MAIRSGIIGKVVQTAGGITFSNWKGKNVMKNKVPDRNTSQSPAQVAQRTKFAALARLAGTMGGAIRLGFRTSATDRTEQNVFQSKNADFVTLDAQGNAVVDYTKLILSAGNVKEMVITTAEIPAAGNMFNVNYIDNTDGGAGLPTDIAVVVAVNKLTGESFVQAANYDRSAAGSEIQAPGVLKAQAANYRVYGFFKRATSTATSPSHTAQVI